MANSYTANTGLAMPALGDTSWNTPINGNAAILDGLSPVGGLAVRAKEIPSASLNVSVAAGSYVKQDGTVDSYAGTASQAIPTATTKVLYLDLTASGALTLAASYPTTPHVRLATVTAGTTTITSVVDNRQCFDVVGSWADGVNIALGSTTGTQIGTATTQKLGFYGATPVVQQTGGAATAGASYTSTEQGMINRMYTALRTLGLLS
jgi:hypothetical protein